jgi:hypothetical protein
MISRIVEGLRMEYKACGTHVRSASSDHMPKVDGTESVRPNSEKGKCGTRYRTWGVYSYV